MAPARDHRERAADVPDIVQDDGIARHMQRGESFELARHGVAPRLRRRRAQSGRPLSQNRNIRVTERTPNASYGGRGILSVRTGGEAVKRTPDRAAARGAARRVRIQGHPAVVADATEHQDRRLVDRLSVHHGRRRGIPARQCRALSVIVESTGTGAGMKLFCGGVGSNFPDIVNASRPDEEERI